MGTATVVIMTAEEIQDRLRQLRAELNLPDEVIRQLKDAWALNADQMRIISEIEQLEWLAEND